ncbi:MAG: hypothetical protein K0U98_24120 [Deltaproteobacteria bacterium]|nr:hypothetical protein [Deltaproteobacteria bacterium]
MSLRTNASLPQKPGKARRPIAGLFRRTAHTAVELCRKREIHPDTISYASIAAGAAAAVCFWQAGEVPWLLLPAVALSTLRLWFNMLDGMVALATGQSSSRGEVLNDLPDRVSDLLIFVGVAHSGLVQPLVAYWAAISALLVAYVGTLGQAVGGRRQFGGMMSKPWRMALLSAASLAVLAAGKTNLPAIFPAEISILDGALILVILGSLQTLWVRLRALMAELESTPR